jgi:hypothetical protein
MKSLLKKLIAMGLSVLMAAAGPAGSLQAETIGTGTDPQQATKPFDPNQSQTNSFDEIPSGGIPEEETLFAASEEETTAVFDPAAIIQEVKDIMAKDVPAALAKMQALAVSFQTLVDEIAADFPAESPFRQITVSVAGNFTDVKTEREARITALEADDYIQRLTGAIGNSSLSDEEKEELAGEFEGLKQTILDAGQETDYYQSEKDFLQARYDSFKVILDEANESFNAIKVRQQELITKLEAAKAGFTVLAGSQNLFIAEAAGDIRAQIQDVETVINQSAAAAEALKAKLLTARVAEECDRFLVPQIEAIREAFEPGGIHLSSEQYFAGELLFYQNFENQFKTILTEATNASQAITEDQPQARKELEGLAKKFKTLTKSSSLFISETAAMLTAQIADVLAGGGGASTVKDELISKIRSSKTLAEAQFHLSQLEQLAVRAVYAESLKYYQSEYKLYDELNRNVTPLLDKAAAAVREIGARLPGLDSQLTSITKQIASVRQQFPDLTELTALLAGVQTLDETMAADLEEAFSLLEKAQRARTLEEVQQMLAALENLKARFKSNGQYPNQIQKYRDELSDLQRIGSLRNAIKTEYTLLRKNLVSLQQTIDSALRGYEALPLALRQVLSPLFEKLEVFSADVTAAIQELDAQFEAAMQERDEAALRAYERRFEEKSRNYTETRRQYSSLSQKILKEILFSRFRHFEFIFRYLR